MTHTIKLSTTEVVIDESTTLSKIKENVPEFFETKFGKRETYTMYRGFLIVRYMAEFSHGSEQKTVIYLYTDSLEGYPDTFCIMPAKDPKSIPQAKKIIDAVISTGQYSYGMNY